MLFWAMTSVVVSSGGMESLVALAKTSREDRAHLLFVNYGQRSYEQEERAVTLQSLQYGAALHRVDLEASFLRFSWLCDPFAPSSTDPADVRRHILPFRNLMVLGFAASLANVVKAGRIVTGFDYRASNAGAARDKSPEFSSRVQAVFDVASEGPVPVIEDPVQGYAKADVVRLGEELGVDWATSWSCYNGGSVHCGGCGSCVARQAGFKTAGVTDPTTYGA